MLVGLVGLVAPVLVASTALVIGSGRDAEAATTLPAGFILQDLATGMVPQSATGPGDLLTDFAYLPDESLIAVGKYGRVQWVPRTGTPRRIATLPVNSTSDLGLISVAVAADYETTRHVYTARAVASTSAGSGANGILRLSRWTVTSGGDGGPTALGSEVPVLETSADAPIHSFGSVIADRDGSVWLTIGDGTANRIETQGLRALDINDVHGKVLRIRPDGSGVPDNPFYDPGRPRAARSLVFASGLRSPFRFSLDPGTGLPILGDVGKNTTEEIDLIRPGYSFGWPCWEGSRPTVGYTDLTQCSGVTTTPPLWEYQHDGSGASVTGGVVYAGTSYPAAYRGRYFFGDYIDQKLWTLAFTATGALTTAPEPAGFGSGIGRPVRFATTPGGDVVFADIATARLRRLVYAPGNRPPTAAFTAGAVPTTRVVTLDAAASTDPDGDLLSFSWDLGDGTTATGQSLTHTYSTDTDRFDVTLTVRDPLGATASTMETVYPGNHPPVLSVDWPDPARTYAVGEVVHAAAGATDQEDGTVQVTWTSRLVHCYAVTDCHDHFGATTTGPTLDLLMDGHEGDTELRISASATDSRGAAVSEELVVLPRQHHVGISSNWPAAFTIGDEQVSSGLFTEGLVLTLVAPEHGHDGLSTFHAWGDGVTTRSRQLTVGSGDVTLDVEYRTPIGARYATDTAFRSRLGSPVGVEQGDLGLRSRVYAGGVAHWSPETGVHFVAGAIGRRYAVLGGPAWCGPPTSDEQRTAGLDGYFNHFSRGCSIFWSSVGGTRWVNGHIRTLWASLGWERSFLGYPLTDVVKTASGTGWMTRFEGGTVFWSSATGARYVRGATLTKYTAMQAEASLLRYPTTHTTPTVAKDGTWQHFQNGSIFWSGTTGAHWVNGHIRTLWADLGWERSLLRYPVADLSRTPSGNGYLTRFQGGTIYWSSATGAHYLTGATLTKYTAMGAEATVLRYPTTNTTRTINGDGTYQHFQGGSIFWSGASGAHPVTGAIRSKWASLGWERSWLGYPTSDPFTVTVGRRQNFQHGNLVWNRSTGTVTAYRT